MATLVLGGLGTALGGGVGGLIGTFVGQAIDGSVLGANAGGRSRLADLSFQSSSYGAELPRIYGTMRVAGAVIWATDLQATPANGSGPKGQASGSTYSYSANFAVALSSRQAVRVGRIWADGKLLRGAAGDLKVATKLRFYGGEADQVVDPLIAAVEGIESTPAYRGLTMVVFEQLQLLEFGNRIPVLTFELIADQEAPSIGAILADASGGLVRGGSDRRLVGYAALGGTVGDAIEPLLRADQVRLLQEGDRLSAAPRKRSLVVEESELGCGTEIAGPRELTKRRSGADLPTRLSVRYYDSALDYQAGEQQACWSNDSRTNQRFEIPATLSATDAKSLAHSLLTQVWSDRESTEFRIPYHHVGVRPGDQLELDGQGAWLITNTSLEGSVVSVACRKVEETNFTISAGAGASIAAVDATVRPTDLVMLDLPAFNELASDAIITIAASGGQTPWRPVPAVLNIEGAQPRDLVLASRAVIGRARSNLAPASADLIDQANFVDVEMGDDNEWLTNCSAEELLGGANLASLGSEIIQFAQAEPMGGKTFRLSRLLRGRFGTEWAMSNHRMDERFVLLGPPTMTHAPLGRGSAGQVLQIVANGLADGPGSTTAQLVFQAESLRPPAPCHLASRMVADDLEVSWVRRSRIGYGWDDYLSTPLGEEGEKYKVEAVGPRGVLGKEVSEERCMFSRTELVSIGVSPITVTVLQIGTHAASRPTRISLEDIL